MKNNRMIYAAAALLFMTACGSNDIQPRYPELKETQISETAAVTEAPSANIIDDNITECVLESEPAGSDDTAMVTEESSSFVFPAPVPAGQVNFEPVEIKPQCAPSMGFSFGLPSGWKYEPVQTDDEPTSCSSVYIRNADEPYDSGCIVIEYISGGLGVCGTGLETESCDLNGHPATKGYYYGNEAWSFIALDGELAGCTILNEAEWYDKYKDTIDIILSTIEFRWYDDTDEKPLGFECKIIANDNYDTENSERGYKTYGSELPYLITICSGERSTGGYSLSVTDVTCEDESDIIITVEEKTPSPFESVTEAVTYPSCTVSLNTYPESITVRDIYGNEFERLTE